MAIQLKVWYMVAVDGGDCWGNPQFESILPYERWTNEPGRAIKYNKRDAQDRCEEMLSLGTAMAHIVMCKPSGRHQYA